MWHQCFDLIVNDIIKLMRLNCTNWLIQHAKCHDLLICHWHIGGWNGESIHTLWTLITLQIIQNALLQLSTNRIIWCFVKHQVKYTIKCHSQFLKKNKKKHQIEREWHLKLSSSKIICGNFFYFCFKSSFHKWIKFRIDLIYGQGIYDD